MPINKLDTEGRWAINGTPLWIPGQGVTYEHTNVAGSSSGRSEDGVMHIDWVRRDVVKVTIRYGAMTGSELAQLVNLVQGKEYDGTYEDIGGVQTRHFYTGDINYTLETKARYASEGGLYTDISFDMVEK